ncbi:hypothetical protein B0H19DRAFT_214083 [Mycena capillaripes]|nr:hypothetical protein B0H19DRAFT_214083 [Mycena capillaripes]
MNGWRPWACCPFGVSSLKTSPSCQAYCVFLNENLVTRVPLFGTRPSRTLRRRRCTEEPRGKRLHVLSTPATSFSSLSSFLTLSLAASFTVAPHAHHFASTFELPILRCARRQGPYSARRPQPAAFDGSFTNRAPAETICARIPQRWRAPTSDCFWGCQSCTVQDAATLRTARRAGLLYYLRSCCQLRTYTKMYTFSLCKSPWAYIVQ